MGIPEEIGRSSRIASPKTRPILYPATLPLHGSYDLGPALKHRPQKLFGWKPVSKIKRFRKATCGYLIWFWGANHLPFAAASLRFWTLKVSNFKSQAAWNQSCCQSEMRLWPSKRKTVHFCISSCFLTVTRLHRLGPGIFISLKFTARWLPLYGQSSESVNHSNCGCWGHNDAKIKTEESWKNGFRIQERDFPDHGFMDDFGMILGWFCDDFGMICDDCVMILGWFVMILWWFCDDFVMILGWFWDDFGMICDDNKLKQSQKKRRQKSPGLKAFRPKSLARPGGVFLAWFPPVWGPFGNGSRRPNKPTIDENLWVL